MFVLEERDAVCVATAPNSRRSAFTRIQVGSRLPAHATAAGQALLASLNDKELEAFLDEGPLERFTDETITHHDDLRTRIAQIREKGFSIVTGTLEFGLQAIAVPLTLSNGRTLGAVNASRRASNEGGEALRTIFLPALLDLANQCCRTHELLASAQPH